jgi:hypothetical protein
VKAWEVVFVGGPARPGAPGFRLVRRCRPESPRTAADRFLCPPELTGGLGGMNRPAERDGADRRHLLSSVGRTSRGRGAGRVPRLRSASVASGQGDLLARETVRVVVADRVLLRVRGAGRHRAPLQPRTHVDRAQTPAFSLVHDGCARRFAVALCTGSTPRRPKLTALRVLTTVARSSTTRGIKNA